MATHKRYTDDEDDDDLNALRKAALKTLNSNKRKREPSPVRRSSSQSYSSSSSRSDSSSSRSSLSSISSDSLHDKDYRFEGIPERATGDIDERFPAQEPLDNDMLILSCPIQDDDLLPRDLSQSTAPKPDKRDEFDLRQLIKKRRPKEADHPRTVELSSNANQIIVHRKLNERARRK